MQTTQGGVRPLGFFACKVEAALCYAKWAKAFHSGAGGAGLVAPKAILTLTLILTLSPTPTPTLTLTLACRRSGIDGQVALQRSVHVHVHQPVDLG